MSAQSAQSTPAAANTQPVVTAPDHVNIEIDGKALQVPKGAMIIQAADKIGVQIPRFCYHDKLPIAANCRMCLVEVEKMPKPAPACATPVMEGMKIHTQSQRALSAQRNVMEFLLVNHPLDCPICDQGGECELQDVAMGYGRSVSRFTEDKRVVADEDLGPLVATEMTRCIHCTRCVRFMDEIAGTTELGGMGRGETLEIGTYIGRSIRTELSGNIIDVCPVGALTNKVFRFRARPWELVARASIGYHDSLHSNLYIHTRRGEAMRVVPRDNEAINESWLSDRDRYSHEALSHPERTLKPKIKRAGAWRESDWASAIAFCKEQLQSIKATHGAAQIGTLVGPMASAEDCMLLARLTRGMGSNNIDHRLRQLDFSDDAARAIAPMLASPLADIESARAILLVGCNPRMNAPILGHKVRKAWKRGCKVYAVNPADFDFHFQLEQKLIGHAQNQVAYMLALAKAAADATGKAVPATLSALLANALPSDNANAIVTGLMQSQPARVLFGEHAAQHHAASVLRACAQFVAAATGADFDEVPDTAAAVGAWRTGAVPHRSTGGAAVTTPGLHARAMLDTPLRAYILAGVEVNDFALGSHAIEALAKAACVIVLGSFSNPTLETLAHVILPAALPPESEGSYINAEGLLQTHAAAVKAPGDARASWRVLRVLGAELGLDGFGFNDFGELNAELIGSLATNQCNPAPVQLSLPSRGNERGMVLQTLTSIYSTDAVVRRSRALQETVIAAKPVVRLHPEDALGLGLSAGAMVHINNTSLAVEIDRCVPKGGLIVAAGLDATLDLPLTGSIVALQKR